MDFTETVLILASLANAQLPTGSIVGRIVDSSGGVLPGDAITVIRTGKREHRTGVSAHIEAARLCI